jgi:Bacterial regulatory proteins, lacI family
MATILELARHADVSAESVLRVVHGEPVSEDVARRVRAAIQTLGPPPSPAPAVEVLPATAGAATAGTRDGELLERFAQAASELETSLPQGVSSVVYEALRVEVRPVAEQVAHVSALFEQMVRRLEQIEHEVGRERHERLDDVALLTDLIATGWRGVDRRLGRLEKMIERLETQQPGGKGPGRVVRLEDHQTRTAGD